MARYTSFKRTKNGVTYESYEDKVNQTIETLIALALTDVGKFLVKEAGANFDKKTNRVFPFKNKRRKSVFQYWRRKIENDLIFGTKTNDTWYGYRQELGSVGKIGHGATAQMNKWGIITESVENNIDVIRKITAQYLTGINDEPDLDNLKSELESNNED